MATIRDALNLGVLEEFRLPFYEPRPALRPLYIAAVFYDEVDAAEDLHDAGRGKGGRSRFEHLLQTFVDFRCEKRPLVGDLRRLQPTRLGLWKMHPPLLRMFGWVPEPHQFVVVNFARIEDCHGPGSVVDQRRQAVLEFAKAHKLENTIRKEDHLALFPAHT
jgi:hypothetical protein